MTMCCGHKSGDEWYSEQVRPTEHITFIIQDLLDNMSNCSLAGDFADFSHPFARFFLYNLGKRNNKSERFGGSRVLYISLTFWPEIDLVVWGRI